MALNQLVDTRDVRFLLFEMLGAERLLKLDTYRDFDRETFEATLDLAETIAAQKIYEANLKGDAVGAVYDPKSKAVHLPEGYKKAWIAFREAGFPGLIGPQEYGGVGMPELIWRACLEYIQASSVAFSMYATLNIGAYQLIQSFGSSDLKKTFLAKMISGQWSGTMCLTEPMAGSDVGALRTKAVKQSDGSYKITGNKIFITGGEHDLSENIIHPVLARIEGDPEGTKGISIFIVPKFLINADGSLGKRNDMFCSGIEHKMGIKASATCSLTFGDQGTCVGYLLGAERQGMAIMFQMMNAARLEVASQGMALSSTAYMHAVNYAKNRVQGYDPANRGGGSVTIIEHPDVRRMLLWMKSYCEAMRALTYLGAMQYDLAEHASGQEKEDAQALLDFIIPICKAGNTDNAWLVTAEAIQVYGGYGYCSEYPVEQMARDAKIGSLYEGTNGIQSLDLLMRKLLANPGMKSYNTYKASIIKTLEAAGVPAEYKKILEDAVKSMDKVVAYLGGELKANRHHKVLASAVPLQKAFKMLSYAWVHAWSLGLTLPKISTLVGSASGSALKDLLSKNSEAAYYYGRARSARFFLKTEFQHFSGHVNYLLAGDDEAAQVLPEEFTGALA